MLTAFLGVGNTCRVAVVVFLMGENDQLELLGIRYEHGLEAGDALSGPIEQEFGVGLTNGKPSSRGVTIQAWQQTPQRTTYNYFRQVVPLGPEGLNFGPVSVLRCDALFQLRLLELDFVHDFLDQCFFGFMLGVGFGAR